MSAPTACLHAIVRGIVQGVSFRYYTIEQARRLGLTGWVMNRRDGSVEVLAEGPEQQLKALLDYLRVGPPAARVTGVLADWRTPSGQFQAFDARYL